MTSTSRGKKTGMTAFFTIWLGQSVSQIGTGLTGFAVAVWVYDRTGSVTQFSLMLLATYLPGVLISPLAGTVVDRWDRRWVMILSDFGAALCTLATAGLLFSDSLELWMLAALRALSSTCEAFQGPAYSASVPLLVPKKRLGNINGLIQLSAAMPRVVAPLLAGFLVTLINIWGIFVVDFVTFLIAAGALMLVRIPKPEPSAEGAAARGSLLREATRGWSYLRMRPGLLAILGFFAVCFFSIGIINVAAPTLILSFASEKALGTVLSVTGFGFVAGSLVMSAWGGPKRRVDGVFGFSLMFGFGIVLAGIHPSIAVLAVGVFLISFSAAIISGCSQALWQTKVPMDLQGRVAALRTLVVSSATLVAYVVAGPLADRVFEPLMAVGGAWAGSVGRILGVGPGRGVGLMLVLFGIPPIVGAILAYAVPKIRLVEDHVPDAMPGPPAAPPQEPESAEREAEDREDPADARLLAATGE